jgi:hypothetical protein
MVKRPNLIARLTFGIIALLFCGLVALRPIPNELEEGNDTGRYIVRFYNQAEKSLSLNLEESISWQSFDLLMTPAVWVDSDWFFLFLTALAVPLGILLFGTWQQGTFILSLAFLFSVSSFEFMTNAMRQGCSLFFLLAAFWCNKKLFPQIIFAIIAVLLHDSAVVFIPLLLGLKIAEQSSHQWRSWIIYIIVAIGIIGLFLASQRYLYSVEQIIDSSTLFEIMKDKYVEVPSFWYLLYMVAPVLWVFCVRAVSVTNRISKEELFTFIYLIFIFTITYIIFPYITYRFAMTGTVLQLFLAMKAIDSNIRINTIIVSGIFIHLIIFLVFSNHISRVLFGT